MFYSKGVICCILLSSISFAKVKIHADPNLASHEELSIKSLQYELLNMVEEDQKIRYCLAASSGNKELQREVRLVDAKHLIRLKTIVDQYGWPPRSLIGDKASHDFSLLVLHQIEDPEFQEKCLNLLKEAVYQKEALAENYAYLFDKVCLNKGLPQLYGTQLFENTEGKYEPYPVQDPEHLDTRRQEMGLSPIHDYLQISEENLKKARLQKQN
jgi:hypothetical protein